MAEIAENQELDDIQLDVAGEENGEENSVEEVRDEFAFLRNNSDDLSLYLAFKAYHDDGNYQEAIQMFASAIDYEQEHGAPTESGPDGEEKPNEALVRSFYWMAESHLKLQQDVKALTIFEKVASDFDNHHLGQAAQRRIDRLKANE